MVMAYQAQSKIVLAKVSPFKLFVVSPSISFFDVRMYKLLKDIIFFVLVFSSTQKNLQEMREKDKVSDWYLKILSEIKTEDRSPI